MNLPDRLPDIRNNSGGDFLPVTYILGADVWAIDDDFFLKAIVSENGCGCHW